MSIFDIVESIEEIMVARMEEKSERDRYTGMDWGYHGYEFQRKVNHARELLEQRLNDHIDDRIKEYLSKESK